MPGRYVQGPGPWCGTVGGRTHHGCTCERCKAAHAADQDQRRNQPLELGTRVHHRLFGYGEVVGFRPKHRYAVRYRDGKFKSKTRVHHRRDLRLTKPVSKKWRPPGARNDTRRYAVLLLLSFGLSQAEVGKVLGVHQGTVSGYLCRARATLPT